MGTGVTRKAGLIGVPEPRVAAQVRRLHAGDPGRRDRHSLNGGRALGAVPWALGVTLGLCLVAGCSITVNPTDGATTGVGENSAFTEAGNEHILEEGRARIDLREPLTSVELGADADHPLRDLDARGEDPIEITLIGTGGELVVPADVIRVLVESGGDRVQSIALFEEQQDVAALDLRLREVGAAVGADESEIDSYLTSASPGAGRKHDVWLNDNTALGFRIGLHPVEQPDGVALIEYQVTFDPAPS